MRNIMHHQLQTLDSPSVITFSTKRPRMLVPRSFIAQNAPTESCRCTTRIPWYHQNPAYAHRILFPLTAWYYAFVYPYMMYCNPVWGNASAVHINKLHVLQKKIVRIIAGVKPRTSTDDLFRNLNIMKLDEINIFLIAQLMRKQYTADVIPVFQNMFITNSDIHSYVTRQSNHLNIPLCHKNIGKTTIRYRGAIIWNNVLKSGIPLDQSNMLFKQQLRKQIMSGSIRDKLH